MDEHVKSQMFDLRTSGSLLYTALYILDQNLQLFLVGISMIPVKTKPSCTVLSFYKLSQNP